MIKDGPTWRLIVGVGFFSAAKTTSPMPLRPSRSIRPAIPVQHTR